MNRVDVSMCIPSAVFVGEDLRDSSLALFPLAAARFAAIYEIDDSATPI